MRLAGGGAVVPNCMPTSFISPHTNGTGSLREECIVRNLVDGANEADTIATDAAARRFSPEQVRRMVTAQEDFDGLQAFMQGQGDDHGFDARARGDAAALEVADGDDAINGDTRRLADEIAYEPPQPLPPRLTIDAAGIATWHDTEPDGTTNNIVLTTGQYTAYMLHHDMGAATGGIENEKQLLTFLSGEGGTGKSTLIRLLVQAWRARGLRVRITASTGKAARLIGGLTVHSAFRLHQDGFFLNSTLERGSAHFKWLATADIIIIDEISMLTAATLQGINAALNFVTMYATTQRGHMAFGRKRCALPCNSNP